MEQKDSRNDQEMTVGLDFIAVGQRPLWNISETSIQKYWEWDTVKFVPVQIKITESKKTLKNNFKLLGNSLEFYR